MKNKGGDDKYFFLKRSSSGSEYKYILGRYFEQNKEEKNEKSSVNSLMYDVGSSTDRSYGFSQTPYSSY